MTGEALTPLQSDVQIFEPKIEAYILIGKAFKVRVTRSVSQTTPVSTENPLEKNPLLFGRNLLKRWNKFT